MLQDTYKQIYSYKGHALLLKSYVYYISVGEGGDKFYHKLSPPVIIEFDEDSHDDELVLNINGNILKNIPIYFLLMISSDFGIPLSVNNKLYNVIDASAKRVF